MKRFLAAILAVPVTLMTFAFGAPAVQAAAPAATLVISEVKTDQSGTDEFIELYNPTASAINIQTMGLKLHIHDAAGDHTNVPLDFVNTTVPANGFFLIAHTGSTAATSGLADATYTSSTIFPFVNQLDDNGAVYISTSVLADLNVIDLVGWGAQPVDGYETAPVATNPTAVQSLERQPGATYPARGNAIDTDNNAVDFALRQTSEAQGTTSPIETLQTPAPVTSLAAIDTPNDQGGSVTVTWTKSVDDGAGLNNVTGYAIWRRLTTGTYPLSPIGSVAAGVTTFVDTTATTGTAYVYRVETLDGAYSSYSTQSAAVMSADNVGPTVTITNPTGTFVATQDVVVAGTIVDPAGVASATLAVDGGTPVVLTLDATGAFSQTLVGLAAGDHVVVIRATDTNGLVNELTLPVTVDLTKPVATLSLPARTTSFTVTATVDATDNVSGVTSMQFSTDGVFDTEAWEAFAAQSVRNLPQTEGQQTVWVRVRDAAGNISDPVSATILVEVTPSSKPTNAVSSTTGNTVILSWEAAAGAVAYIVRYTDGQVMYGPIRTTNTSMVINNLDSSKTYQFEVAAINPAGTISEFVKIAALVAPTANTTTTTTTELPTGGPVEDPTLTEASVAPRQVAQTTVSPSPSPETTVSPSPSPTGEVLADEDDQSPDWTRIVVALSILIIAAGVATGGWYLYQWWVGRPTGTKGKGGRW